MFTFAFKSSSYIHRRGESNLVITDTVPLNMSLAYSHEAVFQYIHRSHQCQLKKLAAFSM